MVNLNNNFPKLQDNYIFSGISKKFPNKKLINMEIVDVFCYI